MPHHFVGLAAHHTEGLEALAHGCVPHHTAGLEAEAAALDALTGRLQKSAATELKPGARLDACEAFATHAERRVEAAAADVAARRRDR